MGEKIKPGAEAKLPNGTGIQLIVALQGKPGHWWARGDTDVWFEVRIAERDGRLVAERVEE